MIRIPDVKLKWNECKTDFYNHIKLNTNARILFSAPFGAGKSSFIKQFFEDFDQEFITVALSPVNYAIASNQDVFELIKFDILTDLLVSHAERLPSIQSQEFSLALRSYAYLASGTGIGAFVKNIVSATGEIGKSAISVLEALEKLNIDFSSFSSQIENVNKQTITDYISEFKTKKGSVYEMDDISNIITQCLVELKALKENVHTVLIIEDLDRLDPEHIFRLFNIFSANFNLRDEDNKFGFDKVVFVCDIENIRKMYFHRYGQDVDFTGYMNKFYSSEPFAFDSGRFLKKKIGELLNGNPWYTDSSLKERYATGNFRSLQKHILTVLINENLCTLRMLDQAPQFNLSARDRISPPFGSASGYPTFFFDFYVFIAFLRTLYPSLELIERHLKVLAEKFTADHQPMDIFGHSPENLQKYVAGICLIFLLPVKQIFSDELENDAKTLTVEQGNSFIRYHLEITNTRPPYAKPVATNFTMSADATLGNRVNLNIYRILYDALKICIEKGYILR